MTAQQSGPSGQTPIPIEQITLEPLRTHGRDALDCQDVPGLESVTLCGVKLAWENDLNEIRILKSEDLFSGGLTIPIDAGITEAQFNICTGKNSRPQTITIRPPRTLRATCASVVEIAREWATKRHFIPGTAAAELAIALLLAALGQFTPDLDGTDDDDEKQTAHSTQVSAQIARTTAAYLS